MLGRIAKKINSVFWFWMDVPLKDLHEGIQCVDQLEIEKSLTSVKRLNKLAE